MNCRLPFGTDRHLDLKMQMFIANKGFQIILKVFILTGFMFLFKKQTTNNLDSIPLLAY